MKRLLISLPITLLILMALVLPATVNAAGFSFENNGSLYINQISADTHGPISHPRPADNVTNLPDGLTLTKGIPFVSPTDIKVGDLVTVKIKASNSSVTQINHQLTLQVNGKATGSPQQISVAAGETKDVSFQFTAQTSGVNAITIGNLSGTFTVGSGSFLDMFPPYLWAFFGIVLGIIVMMIVLLVMKPKKKSGAQADQAKRPVKGKQGKPGKPGAHEGPPLMPQGMQRPGMTGMPEGMLFGQQPGAPGGGQDMGMGGMQPPFQQQGQPGMQPPFGQGQPGMQQQFQPQGQPGQPPFQQQGQPGMQPPFQPQGQPGQQPQQPIMQQPYQPHGQQGMPPPQQPPMRGPQYPPQPQMQGGQQPHMGPGSQPPMQGPQQGMPFGMQPPQQQMPQGPGMQPPMHMQGQPPMPPSMQAQAPHGMQPPMEAGYQSMGMPKFAVSNLTITPNKVKVGEPVNISIIVCNNGMQTGKYSVVLRIGGVVENISDMTLPPSASQTASFTVTKDAPGDYYADIDGMGGFFTAIPLTPPSFTVSNFSIGPERVRQGQPVIVTAMVTNTGEVTGNHILILRVKGLAESQQEITLSPGKTQNIEFQIVKDTPGFYPVSLENWTGKFVVEMDWTG